MTQIFYLKSTDDETGARNVVVFVAGQEPATASSESHPNFDAIIEAVEANFNGEYGAPSAEEILDLFDVSVAVAKYLEPLSERVSVANGRVYLDGDEVENSLTRQIVRFLEEGLTDWYPLVRFFENLLANPNEHSREQLYEWLNRRDFTIDDEGCIIAYKGVNDNYESRSSGKGIVNGVPVNGRLDNTPGNTVEMARSEVQHDPSVGCHTGLHVGTFEYASGFGPKVLKIQVNPRDIVSVPTDCEAQKVRCCRYTVLEDAPAKLQSAYYAPTFAPSFADDEDDYDPDEGCGDPDCEDCNSW